MSQTYSSFKEDVKLLAFPEGLSDNLEYPFSINVLNALIYIQRWVPYYQRHNREEIGFCATLFSCGATVIEKPRGRPTRIYTLENDCCPIYYDHVQDFDEFLNWINYNRRSWENPSDADLPGLPAGFHFSEAVTDKGKRYNFGKYSFKNEQIYLGHRIESSEKIVVEWEGVRRKYEDSDLMPYDDADEGDATDWGSELKDAVASYVRAEFARVYRRDIQMWQAEKAEFSTKVAELKYEDRRERMPKIKPEPKYDVPQVTTPCVEDMCQPPTPDWSGYFAILGDWGKLPADLRVESLIESWDPDFIVTVGDNRYSTSYKEVFTAFQFFRSIKEKALFFPGIGNHDTDEGGGISEFLSEFPYLPGDKRNFDIQLGNVHFFFRETHDSGAHLVSAADLARSADTLRVRLASSQAPWKVVITQDPPYVSDSSNGDGHAASQLDYKGWGADLVVSGDSHFYERLLVDCFHYIVNGSGGATPMDPTDPIDGSIIRYNEDFGAIRGRATCDTLVLEFFNASGVLIDTLTLNHDDDCEEGAGQAGGDKALLDAAGGAILGTDGGAILEA